MYVRRPEYRKVDEEYFCTVPGCNVGYGFNSMYGLRKHFHGRHTREEEKFFQCDYCDEKFSFKTTRYRRQICIQFCLVLYMHSETNNVL